jgi:hypothetical protein
MSNQQWKKINTIKDLPAKNGMYFVTDKYSEVFMEHLFLELNKGFSSQAFWIKHYIAWMPIEFPNPYKGS